MIRSYSLEEVAAQHLPAEWKEPVRWLKTKIHKGEINAKRLSRGVYRMTDAQIDAWLSSGESASAAKPAADPVNAAVTPIVGGLSQRSQRRAYKSVSA
jgi:hypothetical protein